MVNNFRGPFGKTYTHIYFFFGRRNLMLKLNQIYGSSTYYTTFRFFILNGEVFVVVYKIPRTNQNVRFVSFVI